MTVVAVCHMLVAAFDPAVVLPLHYMAVCACLAPVAHVRIAARIHERVAAHAEEEPGQKGHSGE